MIDNLTYNHYPGLEERLKYPIIWSYRFWKWELMSHMLSYRKIVNLPYYLLVTPIGWWEVYEIRRWKLGPRPSSHWVWAHSQVMRIPEPRCPLLLTGGFIGHFCSSQFLNPVSGKVSLNLCDIYLSAMQFFLMNSTVVTGLIWEPLPDCFLPKCQH